MKFSLGDLPALSSFLNKVSTQNFVVAYSGGVDSHVLLHFMHDVLSAYPQHNLSAIHINHGLNAKADLWQQHCAKVCADLTVPIQFKELKLQLGNRQSLEAVARQARYRALEQLSPVAAVILLGQHLDDQTETFLLQLKRGAGPKGLSAMPREQALGDKVLLRPLLNLSQQQVLNYARHHALSWVEDDSNQNIDFDRNFLRHQVLPKVQQRWPGFSASVARSANLCAEQQQLLDEVTEQKLTQCQSRQLVLDLTPLFSFSAAWQRQVIRLWLSRLGVSMPSEALLKQLLQQMAASSDAEPQVRHDDWVFRRFREHMYLLPWQEQTDVEPISWQGQSRLEFGLAKGLYFSEQQVENSLALSFSAEVDEVEIKVDSLNQRFKPLGQQVSKPIKQWYKLWSIPPWERSQIPQVFVNGKLVALGGMAISADYQPCAASKTYYLYMDQ